MIKRLHSFANRIDWPYIIFVLGALLAAAFENLLACFLWIGGFVLGYVLGGIDRKHRGKSNGIQTPTS